MKPTKSSNFDELFGLTVEAYYEERLKNTLDHEEIDDIGTAFSAPLTRRSKRFAEIDENVPFLLEDFDAYDGDDLLPSIRAFAVKHCAYDDLTYEDPARWDTDYGTFHLDLGVRH
jgi:hypothetical protein